MSIYKKLIIFFIIIINCIGLFKLCNAQTVEHLTSINNENINRLEKIKEKGVLTILMANIPTASFIDPETKQPMGVDIEILNEFAKRIGVNKIEVKVVDTFPEVLEKLNTDDSVDVSASGIIITDKRKESVNFTQPLYSDSEAIIIPKVSRINFKEDLKNSVVGVQLGSVFEDLATKWKSRGEIKDVVTFKSIDMLLSAVLEKKVDAALIDSITEEYLLSGKNKFYLKALKPYTPELSDVIGIAVRKDDISLLNELNKQIDNMKADKTIKKILDKYGVNDSDSVNNIKTLTQGIYDVKDAQILVNTPLTATLANINDSAMLLIINPSLTIKDLVKLNSELHQQVLHPLQYGDLIVILGKGAVTLS